MPAVSRPHVESSTPGIRPYYVLVTGFGVSPPYPPFSRYAVNPSWLAVKPLHNTLIHVDVPAEVTMHDHQGVPTEPETITTPTQRDIHITTLKVPVIYEDILSIVPGFYARPPVLPSTEDSCSVLSLPPDGYDLILHVGVAGRGPLRMERVGHKFGYNMKDAKGCHAPIVRVTREEASRGSSEPSEAERMERSRLGYVIEGPIDGSEPPKRGFGKGYESFPEEIYTDVDVEKLVHHLKKSGVEQIYSSLDAGHYLCDFIYYCSLAESRRSTPKTDKPTTKVLFLHCPPVDQPLSTEEVTAAIKKSIMWLCTSIAS
ncbi:peptidase C15, pyroglutamyl peptidase I-like protein [Paxillus ammoniavirescens]|nr:peptidase C15, pyroglutamyl peptidase I-like protein [Paxillus ammoniavirescens]